MKERLYYWAALIPNHLSRTLYERVFLARDRLPSLYWA